MSSEPKGDRGNIYPGYKSVVSITYLPLRFTIEGGSLIFGRVSVARVFDLALLLLFFSG